MKSSRTSLSTSTFRFTKERRREGGREGVKDRNRSRAGEGGGKGEVAEGKGTEEGLLGSERMEGCGEWRE